MNDTIYVCSAAVDAIRDTITSASRSLETERLKSVGLVFLGYVMDEPINGLPGLILAGLPLVVFYYLLFKNIVTKKTYAGVNAEKTFDQNWENRAEDFWLQYKNSLNFVETSLLKELNEVVLRTKISVFILFYLLVVPVVYSLFLL